MCECLHQMKTRGNVIKIIRLDPAGENHKLEKRCATADWKELQPIEFEFTSQDTPQHNDLAELAFLYLSGKAQAMMGAAHVPVELQGQVVVEALKCATQLDRLRMVEIKGK